MIVQGRNEIEFDIIMGDGYKIPFLLLRKLFSRYSLEKILLHEISTNTDYVYVELDNYEYDYAVIFNYFVHINLLKRMSSVRLMYFRILDKDKFIEKFNELTDLYLDIHKNTEAYEREFLIDSLIN